MFMFRSMFIYIYTSKIIIEPSDANDSQLHQVCE
jgi:hypothetical protein